MSDPKTLLLDLTKTVINALTPGEGVPVIHDITLPETSKNPQAGYQRQDDSGTGANHPNTLTTG